LYTKGNKKSSFGISIQVYIALVEVLFRWQSYITTVTAMHSGWRAR